MKAQLRQQMLDLSASNSAEDKQDRNQQGRDLARLVSKVLVGEQAQLGPHVRYGAAFMPLQNEIDVLSSIENLQDLKVFPDIRWAFPKLVRGQLQFLAVSLSENSIADLNWTRGEFGVRELDLQETGTDQLVIPVVPNEISFYLVPGVAFDKTGARLGRGKGYYDRVLRDVSSLKIGVCPQNSVVQSVPTEAHDVFMDYVVTEKEIINCHHFRSK